MNGYTSAIERRGDGGLLSIWESASITAGQKRNLLDVHIEALWNCVVAPRGALGGVTHKA